MTAKDVAVAEHAVVIAGAGPTGLMLAGELALAGVDTLVVEQNASRDRPGSRASGLHSRTLEVLDQRGIADRFVSQGQKYPVVPFHVALDLRDFPSRHNYVLGLWQQKTERILADWVGELRVPILSPLAVTGFSQDERGVDVEVSDGRTLRAQYLVGCDGGRSLIRKIAGIEFPGWNPTTSWTIAEMAVTEKPELGFRRDAAGTHAIGKAEGERVAIVLTDRELVTAGEPTLAELKAALVAVYGTDFGAHDPSWISRFTDVTRQAASYREGRVLLAGDAAHIHPPIGGQGLNIGVQDAVNLGWKLAQVVKGISHESLLDTYHRERHPVGARVLQTTMAQMALRRPDERAKALADIFSELLTMDEPRRRLAGKMSGLDVRYDLGDGHRLVGRRMPDFEIRTEGRTARVFSLLHAAMPVLLNLAASQDIDVARWADRITMIDAEYSGSWELPVIGLVEAPSAVLIRPDGYVAWVGRSDSSGLERALFTWCGAPAPW